MIKKDTSKQFKISYLFKIESGDFHAKSELDPGHVPLISCGEENNGLVGYYDIPEEKTHHRVLTVSFNGFPLTTKFHPYRFGAKDDVAVLLPLEPMSDSVLIYIAAILNGMRWRYSYGRKCFKEKLQDVDLLLPSKTEKGRAVIDSSVPELLLKSAFDRVTKITQNSIETLFEARS